MIEMLHNILIDYDELKSLYSDPEDLSKAWPGAKYPLCPIEWSNWIKSGVQSASLLFKYQNENMGHALLRSNDQGQLFLCFVVLIKKYRGDGYIYEMLKEIEAFALVNFSHKEIYLHVDPSNVAALKAYKNHGYVNIAVTDKGRFRMRKSIADR